jgi:hypothetical protein
MCVRLRSDHWVNELGNTTDLTFDAAARQSCEEIKVFW